MDSNNFLLNLLPAFVRKSLRAKIALFFILFALLITIEMVILSVLRKKALALPKQIELALASQYHSQEARINFNQFINNLNHNSADALGNFEASKHFLQVLIKGGRVAEINFEFSPSEGSSKSIAENIHSKTEILRKDVIEIFAQLESKSTAEHDSLLLMAKADIIDIESRSAELKKEYDLLVTELRNEMTARQSTIATLMAVILLVDVIVLGFFFVFMSRNISRPLKNIADAAMRQELNTITTEDEIGVVAGNLNEIINQLKGATTFIEAIGEGKLDVKISNSSNDSSLSNALLNMQQKLKIINDEEQKRKWATEGLAKFVEILRTGDSNLVALGDNVIKALVNYTGATQGGLYVWNDDQPNDPFIQLIASYAYNRKKYEEREIKAGEGLLGQAYLEKATTHLTEIPANYFRVISGLGEMDPQSILIVPLISNNNVYGLVELASLKKFEEHEIAFVEKLGESVAATLASVKTNEKNRKLLQDFQEQTENLRSQEEEMRQNMEELTATQEEMARKELDYVKQIEELKMQLRENSSDSKWEIAQQTEQSLKENLKALNIALNELKKSN